MQFAPCKSVRKWNKQKVDWLFKFCANFFLGERIKVDLDCTYFEKIQLLVPAGWAIQLNWKRTGCCSRSAGTTCMPAARAWTIWTRRIGISSGFFARKRVGRPSLIQFGSLINRSATIPCSWGSVRTSVCSKGEIKTVTSDNKSFWAQGKWQYRSCPEIAWKCVWNSTRLHRSELQTSNALECFVTFSLESKGIFGRSG